MFLKFGLFLFFLKVYENVCLIDDNCSKLFEKYFSINMFYRVYEVKEIL